MPGEQVSISRTCANPHSQHLYPNTKPASLRGIYSPSLSPWGPKRRRNRFHRLSLLPSAPVDKSGAFRPRERSSTLSYPAASSQLHLRPNLFIQQGSGTRNQQLQLGEGKQSWGGSGWAGREGFTAGPRRVIKETERRHPGHREQARGDHSCRTPAIGPHLVAGPGLKRSGSQGGLRAHWTGCRTDAGRGGGPGSFGALLSSPRGDPARRSRKPLSLSSGDQPSGPEAPSSGLAPSLGSGRAPSTGNAVLQVVPPGPEAGSCWGPRWGDREPRVCKPWRSDLNGSWCTQGH